MHLIEKSCTLKGDTRKGTLKFPGGKKMINSRPETVAAETSNIGNCPGWEVLQKLAGQWVAFSADGSRIVAHGKDLAELDRRVTEAGEDPEEVAFLRIPDRDMIFSGAEFQ
jgi:hypothetical protein